MMPNRKQFAEVIADAYANQYHGGQRVMNQPQVMYDYETNKFSWQSTLTPNAGRLPVVELEDGMFGPGVPAKQRNAKAAIKDFVAKYNDDLWNSVLDDIEEYREEYEDEKTTKTTNNTQP